MGRHKIPRRRNPSRRPPVDKGSIVIVRHKAYFLTVRLLCHGQPRLLRHPAYIRLLIFPHGHQRMGQLMLRQIVQGIGLILSGCHGPANGIPSVLQPCDSGIMPRGNKVRPHGKASGKQGLPFHIPVACDAGIGGAALKIFFRKIIYDPAPKLLL